MNTATFFRLPAWLVFATVVAGAPASLSAAIADQVVRATIGGIDLLVAPTAVQDVVTIRGSLPAGDAHAANGNPAVATLARMMLEAGTTRRDKFELAGLLEGAGATISFGSGAQLVTINARCLRAHVALVLELIAEQVRMPAFSTDEFDKAKKRLAGSLVNQLDTTGPRANAAFAGAIYPAGHPNATVPPDEMIAAVERATLAEVRSFHVTHYGPAHLKLVVVGDVVAGEIQREVARVFAGWSGGSATVAGRVMGAVVRGESTIDVFLADKTSINVVLGQASGLRVNDPEYEALFVATAILGGGFTGRLMANVRDREGLTYGIYAALGNDLSHDGDWRISATFSPALVEQGVASMRRQLELWYRDGVSAEELELRKTNIAGLFQVGLATTGGLAGALLDAVNSGRDVAWLDEYPRRIAAVSLSDVNAAIRRRLDPAQMVLVRAGTMPAAP